MGSKLEGGTAVVRSTDPEPKDWLEVVGSSSLLVLI